MAQSKTFFHPSLYWMVDYRSVSVLEWCVLQLTGSSIHSADYFYALSGADRVLALFIQAD